ncbi:MAG: hypothetical protein ACLFVP_00350 [Candidatus Bathyarchaeia archaeon]
MSLTLITAVLISFTVSYISTPIFNRFMRATGIVGYDIMKRQRREVADMGGPGVIVGLLTGVFYYIAIEVFTPTGLRGLIYILASLNTILIITLIGLFDVLTGLMELREGEGIFEKIKRKGIPAWAYFLLPLPAAVPLVAVNAGVSRMTLPIMGSVELGIIYPLVLIPLAVLCCSNATNFLAGFNGLEAGLGSVLHISLGIYAHMNGELAGALISLSFAASLLAFLRYNWYPAKVFPGDLNYTIGATAACVAIISDMEKFAILAFTPWVIEAFLKALSGFKAESFGILQEGGFVKPRDDKIRSLTHILMRMGHFREWQITLILIFIEVVICILSFYLVSYL